MQSGGISAPESPGFLFDEVSINANLMPNILPSPKKERSKRQKDFLKHLFQSKQPKSYETDEKMTELGLPDFLQNAYLTGNPKITKLRDWQEQLCLMPEWQEMQSSVVLVPTSGGKTVAADIAISQALSSDPNAKAIFALPFVALANEKYKEYRERFKDFNVRPYYQNIGGSDFRKGNIAICTYEKAHSLINTAILSGYSNQIKLVVIDEVHMIGEDGRGSTIEALIVKLLLMQHHPRILALTATINEHDACRLASWIGGFPFIWKSRPSVIKQFVKLPNGGLSQLSATQIGKPFIRLKSAESDKDHILPLVRSLISRRRDSTIIIFVNTRGDTVRIADLIATYMFDDTIPLPKVPEPSAELKKRRNELIKNIASNSGFIDETEIKCIKAGVAFHHAGLLLEDRTLIEDAARTKTVSVLVATTTLSAGVNIHGVSRVIIHNVYRTLADGTKHPLTAAQFTQMVGRAGRNGIPGEAYVIAHTESSRELNEIMELSKSSIPNLTPHLTDGEEIDRFFLHCLSTRLVNPTGMKSYVSKCLTFDSKDDPKIDGYCCSIEDRLKTNKLVDQELNSTKFGMAVAGSALSIEEGLALNAVVQEAQDNLCINDEIHFLYLCVSSNAAQAVKHFPYDCPLWRSIFSEHNHVIKLITKMNQSQIDHMQDLVHIYGGLGRVNPSVDRKLDKVFAAVILKDLINEMSMKDISTKYQIDLGVIQKLQMECASYAGQINKFCEISGSGVLAAALNKFRQRLNFAARTDLLALMSLPSCKRETARLLVDKGVISPVILATLSLEQCCSFIVPPGETANEEIIELAKKLLTEANLFAESLSRIEDMEDLAIMREK